MGSRRSWPSLASTYRLRSNVSFGLFIIGPVFHTVESYVLAATEWILNCHLVLLSLVLGGVHRLSSLRGFTTSLTCLKLTSLLILVKTPLTLSSQLLWLPKLVQHLQWVLKLKMLNWKRAFPCNSFSGTWYHWTTIFGVNLRFGKPFIMGLIAGAAGGWLASILNLAGTGFGVIIVPGTLLYLSGQVLKYVDHGTCNTLLLVFSYLDLRLQKRKKLKLKRSCCWRYCICRISSSCIEAETIADHQRWSCSFGKC